MRKEHPGADSLVAQRDAQLKEDPGYQARVERVLKDAENGILPPRIPVEYLVAAGSHIESPG